MKYAYLLIFMVLSYGCGLTPKKSDKIKELKDEYSRRMLSFHSIGGWPSDYDNDGSLWAGLAARAGMSVNVGAAVQPDGRVTRRPFKDSIVPEESASSVSNDMILGVMSGLLYQKDRALLESVFTYGKVNSWVMGYPIWMVGRVILKPNNIALLARAVERLGGPKHPERLIPLIYVPLQESDYPTHLQLVSFILARDVGEANILNEVIVQETCEYNQGDALAMAVCGRHDRATGLLLGDYTYPNYVRGSPNYQRVHWLLAAKIVLEAH